MGNFFMRFDSNNGHLKLREMPGTVRELHIAVVTNNKEAVKKLVEEGVNVNFPWLNPSNPSIKDGNTPLICAVSLNHLDIIQLLIKSGAYINKCDRNGCTPLYKAAFHGRPVLIELLSRSGGDVNLADFIGKTPLHICINNAVVHGNACRIAVKQLVSHGAIIDKLDTLGQAPIHIAAQWKLNDMMKVLIEAKCSVNIVDKKGRTPLYVCVSSLSTKLFQEDMRHQVPCIITLFKASADMLNVLEWILYKGPGITDDLMVDCPKFKEWYIKNVSTPMKLKLLCRKAIQRQINSKGNLLAISKTLPLPVSLQIFMSRKMFYRESQNGYYITRSSHVS